MSKSKGTAMELARKLLKTRGPEVERTFLIRLSPEEAALYQNVLALSWVEIESLATVLTKASEVLFPEHPNPLQAFGRAEAQDHLTGIYRVFLKFTTIPMVIKQTAKMWKTYYDKGVAEASREEHKNAGRLVVKGFPNLPANVRQIITGYILGAMELTGADNIKIQLDESDPDAWCWKISWKE